MITFVITSFSNDGMGINYIGLIKFKVVINGKICRANIAQHILYLLFEGSSFIFTVRAESHNNNDNQCKSGSKLNK